MKTYHVHFSFYDEETGQFDESYYAVTAENRFEARREAWLLRDTDDNARFQSCVKQLGVTWDASPLDLQDYHNARAADYLFCLRRIQHIHIPNATIKNDASVLENVKNERSYFIGGLNAIMEMSRDIGKPFGIRYR